MAVVASRCLFGPSPQVWIHKLWTQATINPPVRAMRSCKGVNVVVPLILSRVAEGPKF